MLQTTLIFLLLTVNIVFAVETNLKCFIQKYVNELPCSLSTIDMDELCKQADTMRKSSWVDAQIPGERAWQMLCENQDGASVLKALECSQDANTKNNIADKCGDINFGSCSELGTARACLIRELKTLCGNDRVTSFLTEVHHIQAYMNNDDRRGTPIFDCRQVIAKVVGVKAW